MLVLFRCLPSSRSVPLLTRSINTVTLKFKPFAPASEWLRTLDVPALRDRMMNEGGLDVKELISKENIELYANLYREMLEGKVDSSKHRHDLGSYLESKPATGGDNVTQIMWPSLYFNANEGPLHQRATALAKALLGDDMEMDFDHLIYKAPGNDIPFPWHQDEGYWRHGMKGLEFSDLRSTSIWIALDDADTDNGCMWMVPGSHLLGYFEHRPVKEGHHTLEVLGADQWTAKGKSYPVPAGGAVLNTGRTLHYTGGNASNRHRRAFIVNFRPRSMIDFERQRGFDHLKDGFDRPK